MLKYYQTSLIIFLFVFTFFLDITNAYSLPCEFYSCLWAAVQEDQFGIQVLLHAELFHLSHQVDIQAQLQKPIHIRQFSEHDGQVLIGCAQTHQTPNQKDERDV